MFVSSGPASSQEPTEVELKTIPSVPKKMTLNTQQGGKGPVCRRASTPVPLSHQARPGMRELRPNPSESHHPPLGYSSSFEPGDKAPVMPRSSWSSDSADSDSSWESLYRVVLLGDPGVGKTSLVNLFAGIQERDLPEQPGEDAYERTLSVDGEETTLLVMDTWETERRPQEEENRFRNHCMQVGNAYVIVYSVTDRVSFESASELRIQLRRTRQAENIPIILVGNKTDLVRCREVSVEESTAWLCRERALCPGGQLRWGWTHSLPRGPGLRRGLRLQVHRDVCHPPAQRDGAL
nr:GTP-binding protein REM 1 isoform X3 [Chrysemys picta bellii]